MPSNLLILCHFLLFLPPISPSIRIFSNELTLLMRGAKYWSFSFSIIPSKKQPGLISFRMDWLKLVAVQGTLRSLLQHHNSKASILWRSAFFLVQFSHLYMTTRKTRALTVGTFASKMMCLLLLRKTFVSDFPPNININPQESGYLGLLTNGSSPPDRMPDTLQSFRKCLMN